MAKRRRGRVVDVPRWSWREAATMPIMALDPAQLPDDIATRKAMLAAATATVADRDAEIANLKLTIAKMQCNRFGSTSERGSKLLDQLELQLAELDTGATQDKAEATINNGDAGPAQPTLGRLTQEKPARCPLPDHPPRERHVHDAPAACQKWGGERLRKLGEDAASNVRPARVGLLVSASKYPAKTKSNFVMDTIWFDDKELNSGVRSKIAKAGELYFQVYVRSFFIRDTEINR